MWGEGEPTFKVGSGVPVSARSDQNKAKSLRVSLKKDMLFN
jgi:hypothetical protein